MERLGRAKSGAAHRLCSSGWLGPAGARAGALINAERAAGRGCQLSLASRAVAARGIARIRGLSPHAAWCVTGARRAASGGGGVRRVPL